MSVLLCINQQTRKQNEYNNIMSSQPSHVVFSHYHMHFFISESVFCLVKITDEQLGGK